MCVRVREEYEGTSRESRVIGSRLRYFNIGLLTRVKVESRK